MEDLAKRSKLRRLRARWKAVRETVSADLTANGAPNSLAITMVRRFFLDPSFKTLLLHRIASTLLRGNPVSRLVGWIVWRHNVRVSGCHIHPFARIGRGCVLPHPVGIVIGDGVEIGTGAVIYQHVTLGRARRDVAREPIVEAQSIIYAGAAVLGPVRVARGTVVGANAVVTTDVPAGHVAVGIPAICRPPTSRTLVAVSEAGTSVCASVTVE